MGSAKPFKPAILHSATLSVLLIVTLMLIALVEIACRTLPNINNDGSFQQALDDSGCSVERRRRDENSFVVPISTIGTQESTETIFVTTVTTAEVQSSETSILAPAPSVYLRIRTTASPSTIPMTTASPSTIPMTTASPSTIPALCSGAPNRIAYLKKSDGRVSNDGDYFVGSYLPTFMAILFALPWVIINRTARSLEPFYQLSRSNGASSETTLTTKLNAITAPLQFIHHQQWTMIISTTLLALGIILTPLAPETVAIHLDGECSATTEGCTGRLGISVPTARAIQLILGIMTFLTTILIGNLSRKKLKVLSDPRGMAGLSLLLLNPDVRRDFTQFRTLPTEAELKSSLQGYTYKLDMLTFPDGFSSIGVVKVIGVHDPPEMVMSQGFPSALPGKAAVADSKTFLEDGGNHKYSTLTWDRKLMPAHRVSASCFFIFLLALAGLILAYHYTSGNNGFEKFMDSQGFGVRFLFTLISVLISLYWRRIFEDMAILSPYHQLVSGNATAQESILVTPPSHPLLAIYSSVFAHHYVLALVATTALLSEVLTITLSTIPFSSANLYNAYMISTWISVGVIMVMLCVLFFLFFYAEPKLPVKPETLAAQMLYLCDSPLPNTFRDMAVLDTRAIRRRIIEYGYRYRLDWCQSSAGAARLTVGFEGR